MPFDTDVEATLALIRERIPLFANINGLVLRELVLSSEILTPRAGDVIFQKNDYTNSFITIVQGDVSIETDGGQSIQLEQGQFFGEMSLLSGRRRSATARAGEDCVLLESPRREIVRLMNNLGQFINDDALYDADPLVKMAVIHHQFESIHPFYDGNGRTGRIINILYLVARGLLDIPVLYLSRYIIRNKVDYYRLLQSTRDTGNWEPWILYMLDGVELTARQTIWIIRHIKEIMMAYKHRIRSELPKIYSQDLLNNLFRHPYTKIESVQADLSVSRLTAAKYLEQLTDKGFIEKHKIGRYNYYVNRPLMNIFMDIPDMPDNEEAGDAAT